MLQHLELQQDGLDFVPRYKDPTGMGSALSLDNRRKSEYTLEEAAKEHLAVVDFDINNVDFTKPLQVTCCGNPIGEFYLTRRPIGDEGKPGYDLFLLGVPLCHTGPDVTMRVVDVFLGKYWLY